MKNLEGLNSGYKLTKQAEKRKNNIYKIKFDRVSKRLEGEKSRDEKVIWNMRKRFKKIKRF